jgi:ketosteroid isomerase-like protein
MSEENVEVVVGYLEAIDLASGIDSLADDVTFAFHGETRHLAGAEMVSGKEAAVAWLADWFSRFEREYRMEVEEARDLGDRVLVVTHHRATGRASGVPVSTRAAQVMTLRGGKIVRQDFFASREEALEAAGLSE